MSEISIKIAKDGNPVPLWDNFQIHSLYEPIKEGESLAGKFLSSLTTHKDTLLVLGLGFGYHILPLLDKFSQIYVAETNTELISKAKDIDLTKPIFEKCQIISDVSQAPFLPDCHIYTLRSEARFAEKFFADITSAVKLADKSYKPAFNQLRVIVNSPVYGGSYTTAQYVCSALESLGVSVHFTDHSVANGLLQKYLHSASSTRVEVSLIEQLTSLLSETLWQDILDFKPHIVFFVAQSPFTDKLMKAINSAGIVSMYWFVEDFRRMTYWNAVCNNFDYFFMIQKGEFEQTLEHYCHKTYGWFPMACEPRIHTPLALTRDEQAFYGADISFMGAAYPNRVRFFQQFTAHLQNGNRGSTDKLKIPNTTFAPPVRAGEGQGRISTFKLWGTGWTDSELSYLDIPLADQRISTQQSNIIYQATKVNINLHSSNDGYTDAAMFDQIGDFINPRTFEIVACGGFQLVDDRESLRELFDADKDIVFFSSVEEAVDKANFYLKNESLRKQIALNAREKVLKFHTYEKRLANMLNTAIQYSPVLTAKISGENKALEDFMKIINDNEFETFINSIEPHSRYSYQRIIDEVYKSTGNLKSYEAFLMLLDTFYTGE